MEPRTQPANTGRFCCQVFLHCITNKEILLCKLLECYAARPIHGSLAPPAVQKRPFPLAVFTLT
jgi:hypothetical protein